MPGVIPFYKRTGSGSGGLPSSSMSILNSVLPNASSLTTSAGNIIGNALNGLPSPSKARLDNAYFGAGSGLGFSSPALQNRGRSLYGFEAENRQRQGIQDLLSLLQGISGTIVPTTGQTMQNDQFGQELGFRREQLGAESGARDRELSLRERQFAANPYMR